MLVQLSMRPGDNVYEAGAGTGYNAALMKHLTGPSGSVTTSDIHEDVAAHARTMLDAAGYGDVRVITRDGALGEDVRLPPMIGQDGEREGHVDADRLIKM